MKPPFHVTHHPEFPECDVSYVRDADGSEIATVFHEPSHKTARAIADAMNKVHAEGTKP